MVYTPELTWKEAKTPNEYFKDLFPAQTAQYGPAFFELTECTIEGFRRVNPVTLNIDLFAAALNDEKLGLSIVYFEPEMQFYYLEPFQNIYMPTSPEKLQTFYRGMLIRSAQELNDDTNKFPLFYEFRSDKYAKQVTSRAKSILAADQSFFCATSPHQRIRGVELHEKLARSLVENMLEFKEGGCLTVTQAYQLFCKLSQERNLEQLKRSTFREIMKDLARDRFNIALRNDVM